MGPNDPSLTGSTLQFNLEFSDSAADSTCRYSSSFKVLINSKKLVDTNLSNSTGIPVTGKESNSTGIPVPGKESNSTGIPNPRETKKLSKREKTLIISIVVVVSISLLLLIAVMAVYIKRKTNVNDRIGV